MTNEITMRYVVDGEVQPDPVRVLWTSPVDGDYVSLLSHPELNYVIVKTSESFTDGQDFDDEQALSGFEITLGRPDAGQLAIALITALINNSDQIIDSYIEQTMARR
jgi:hypothetical protein